MSETTIQVSRTVPSSPERAFDAWTDVERLAACGGPSWRARRTTWTRGRVAGSASRARRSEPP
ncbi:MAG TPA: hypothetical protein VGK78_04025 [Nocardioides sp.]|uniref:hypothetical protein n=1 Tax=Nocardioides sp. TaxID=35761 RepID=UPI002F40B5F7